MLWSKFRRTEITMLDFNEGKACDAGIRRLEESAKASRTTFRL